MAMGTTKESKLKESNSLNIEKDDLQFPASRFTKDQRKDAEKALHETARKRTEKRGIAENRESKTTRN